MNTFKILFSFILFLSINVVGAHAAELDHWVLQQKAIAESRMRINISPHGTRRGAVVASPSKQDPNYYYHWVRDAALTMDVFMRQLESQNHSLSERTLRGLLWDYFTFSEYGYLLPSYDGVGEPRYNVDGQPNQDPWGRPQNDGPALRASLLIRFSRYLSAKGEETLVRERIWPLIRHDLNYVGQNTHRSSVDLWEEVRGHHFYTRMVSRAALLCGGDFARRMGDHAQATWYKAQADFLNQQLEQHFHRDLNQIVETVGFESGHDYKHSGLDVATLLAVLHTQNEPYMQLSSKILMDTVMSLKAEFDLRYNINNQKKTTDLGSAIGRYPEDRYYDGNPWFLSTLAYAEYYYLLGNLTEGDRYMRRVRLHVGDDGSMAEQIGKWNGYMLSARDLTWSYAAFLTAAEAREKLIRMKKIKQVL